MKKINKNLWFVFLFIGLNCSEYNQNRNSRSKIESVEQKIMFEKWSQLDSLKQKILGVDQFQTLEDSIILIELVRFGLHQFYYINLSTSEIRSSLYSIAQRCNPILNPSMEKPDSSCFRFDNNRIEEISESDKLEIIELINGIRISSNERYNEVNDGISFEIKTNYLPQNLDVFLDNPKDPIFEELEKRLNQIGQE